MKNQDEIDTAPVVIKDDTRIEFESIELAPGERAEIVLAPKRPVRAPVLFMSNSMKNCNVTVEQVLHGRAPIFNDLELFVDSFKFGRPINMTVTASEVLKIIVVNNGDKKTTVGASLVANEKSQDMTYRLKGDEIATDKE